MGKDVQILLHGGGGVVSGGALRCGSKETSKCFMLEQLL